MRAPLYGLVLAGGRSRRMGVDKSGLAYHGVPQWRYALDLLKIHCESVFLSARADQRFPDEVDVLVDAVPDRGPAEGLRAAFRRRPDVAWLVMSCDAPDCDADALAELVRHREREAVFYAGEPFPSLWEPSLTARFGPEVESPRAFLQKADSVALSPRHPRWVTSVNTPRERAAWMASRNRLTDERR
jgi:molybdopterin-guanine dinucleotide biosynthesis protein A